MDLYFLKQKKERQMQESYNSNTVTLVLLRGLPGSGKNTLGDSMTSVVISADDYFMVDGEYQFNGSKLGAAHADCLERTKAALRDAPDGGVVVVANTFSQHWEMAPYLYMADNGLPDFMPDLILNTVVDLFDAGLTDEELEERNSHGVPLQGIQKMRSRWEHDWKKGCMTSPFAK
jgi:energy-coupling factor transporter ATP-binding protein EcfA2